jgi:sortase A
MRIIRRIIPISLLLLLLSVFATQAAASPNSVDPVDTGRETTLTLQCVYNSEPLENAEFKIYRVGDISKAGNFRFNEPFSGVYNPRDEWLVVASAMLEEAKNGKIAPKRSGKTDANGVVLFQSTAEDRMSTGVYLVAGEPVKFQDGDENEIKFTPFLVSLPTFIGKNHNGVKNIWEYNVKAVPKAADQYIVIYNGNEEKINNTPVTGVPKNEIFNLRSERLFHMEQPLVEYVRGSSGAGNDKNGFELAYSEPDADGYTFMGWNEDRNATVGYSTVAFSPDKKSYYVYAIWKKDSDPGNPDDPGNSGNSQNQDDQNKNNPATSDTPKKDSMLPQTGMLWWPVPVLAGMGFAVFFIGIFAGGRKKSRNKKRTGGGAILLTGIALVSSAVCLVLYNAWDDTRAGSDISEERAVVIRQIDNNGEDYVTQTAGNFSIDEMPVKNVQGTDFAAVLSIPSLSLELPVRNEWSYPGLRRSPCRYAGSAYTRNLVICGHNYTAHFGNLKKLSEGDDVTVTAMNGDEFRYRVRTVSELSPSSVSEMTESAYDLTLFTCTIGGRMRVTVRCEQVEYIPHSPDIISSEYVLF